MMQSQNDLANGIEQDMIDEQLSGEYDKRLNSQEEARARQKGKKNKKRKAPKEESFSQLSSQSGIRIGDGNFGDSSKKHHDHNKRKRLGEQDQFDSQSKFDIEEELDDILDKELNRDQ